MAAWADPERATGDPDPLEKESTIGSNRTPPPLTEFSGSAHGMRDVIFGDCKTLGPALLSLCESVR